MKLEKSEVLLFEEELISNIERKDISYKSKFLENFKLLSVIVNAALKDEKVSITGLNTKLLYIFNNEDFNPDFRSQIKNFVDFARKVISNSKISIGKEDFESSARIILELSSTLHGEIYSEVLAKFLKNAPIKIYEKEKRQIKGTFSANVFNKAIRESSRYLVCQNDQEENIVIFLTDTWYDLYDQVWKFCKVYFINVEYQGIKKEHKIYYTTSESILVLEPDYLVDVTEIASAFQLNNQSAFYPLFSKFRSNNPSDAMVVGNIINTIFDNILTGKEFDFDSLIRFELKKSPLNLFFMMENDENLIQTVKTKVESIYSIMLNSISSLPKGEVLVEPSYISTSYGLQGRLDALITHTEDENLKEVIELKSGKSPNGLLTITNKYDAKYSINSWRNHFVQASCYNLILSDIYKERRGNSSIYYAKDEKNPIRNAQILMTNYQEIVDIRNQLVSLFYNLSQGKISLLGDLGTFISQNSIRYQKDDEDKFLASLNSVVNLRVNYLREFTAFTFRELINQKIGSYSERDDNGYAGLWLYDLNSKETSRSCITNLILNPEESDFENLYLNFTRTDNEVVNLRVGEQIILYPLDKEGNSLLLKGSLNKAVIKNIDNLSITISLRNKSLRIGRIQEYSNWVIESDMLEHTLKRLPKNILDFTAGENFEVMSGIKKQSYSSVPNISYSELNELQTEIFSKAISAEKYFLIQGPPGTGKTSYMLKSLVRFYFENSNENILVAAYTNRAVDQICSTLKKINGIELIRLGSKESSEHSDILISEMLLDSEISELYGQFKKTRVIVSTISTLLTHSELFDLKEFGITIVDEASQILEPYLMNILDKSHKSIFIGDEKQLPAIVNQSSELCKIEDSKLEEIKLTDLSSSYFERMIKNSINKNWLSDFGMLKDQGRMHEDIMNLASELFYNGELRSLKNENEFEINLPELKGKRVIFINSDLEDNIFINNFESDYISKAIDNISNQIKLHNESIGVISPFRAQCNLIRNNININLRRFISVDTVERFQGSERDIIFLSLATNKEHHISKMSSEVEINGDIIDRKLNVSITRAKEYLIILGNHDILQKSISYKKLIDYLEEQDSIVYL